MNDIWAFIPRLQPVDWYGLTVFTGICGVLLWLDMRTCTRLQELKERLDNASL